MADFASPQIPDEQTKLEFRCTERRPVVVVPSLRPLRILRVIRVLALAGEATRRAKQMLTHKSLHFVLLVAVGIVFAGAAMVTVILPDPQLDHFLARPAVQHLDKDD